MLESGVVFRFLEVLIIMQLSHVSSCQCQMLCSFNPSIKFVKFVLVLFGVNKSLLVC